MGNDIMQGALKFMKTVFESIGISVAAVFFLFLLFRGAGCSLTFTHYIAADPQSVNSVCQEAQKLHQIEKFKEGVLK